MHDVHVTEARVLLAQQLTQLKARRRDVRDLAVALPNTSGRRAALGMELQAIESAIRSVHYRLAIVAEKSAPPAPVPVVVPRPRPRAVVARRFVPVQTGYTLPLPSVPSEGCDSGSECYVVVWRPHRDAPLLSDQFGARLS